MSKIGEALKFADQRIQKKFTFGLCKLSWSVQTRGNILGNAGESSNFFGGQPALRMRKIDEVSANRRRTRLFPPNERICYQYPKRTRRMCVRPSAVTLSGYFFSLNPGNGKRIGMDLIGIASQREIRGHFRTNFSLPFYHPPVEHYRVGSTFGYILTSK